MDGPHPPFHTVPYLQTAGVPSANRLGCEAQVEGPDIRENIRFIVAALMLQSDCVMAEPTVPYAVECTGEHVPHVHAAHMFLITG